MKWATETPSAVDPGTLLPKGGDPKLTGGSWGRALAGAPLPLRWAGRPVAADQKRDAVR